MGICIQPHKVLNAWDVGLYSHIYICPSFYTCCSKVFVQEEGLEQIQHLLQTFFLYTFEKLSRYTFSCLYSLSASATYAFILPSSSLLAFVDTLSRVCLTDNETPVDSVGSAQRPAIGSLVWVFFFFS